MLGSSVKCVGNYFRGGIIKLVKLCLLHGLPTGGRPPAIEARWRPPVDKPAWQAPMSMSVFGASNFFCGAKSGGNNPLISPTKQMLRGVSE